MSQICPTQPSEADIERQIRFELRCVEEGAKRARQAIMEQGLGDSVVGMKLMRRVVVPLVHQIGLAQEEAMNATAFPKRGRAANWWWPVLTVDKHKLAVIILNSVFNAKPREGTTSYAISRVALAISTATYQQVDFDLWEKEQRQLKKELKDGGSKEWTDLERYLFATKQIDQRSWKKFQERLDRTKLEKWSHETGITFGVKCLDFLVQAKPEWFQVKTNPISGGRWETQLILSDECKDTLYDMLEQHELTSPRLLPTLIPPAPWRRTT